MERSSNPIEVTTIKVTRAKLLKSLAILDTPSENEFDGLAKLAAKVCDASIAILSFIDGERLWIKAAFGTGLKEFPRELCPCSQIARSPQDVVIIADLESDERFFSHPLVPEGSRFYAAAPIYVKGVSIGHLSILDGSLSKLSENQKESLQLLADQAAGLVSGRKALEISEFEQDFLYAFEQSPIGMAMSDLRGYFLRVNTAYCDLLGYSKSELLRLSFQDITHPDDLEADLGNVRRLMSGEVTSFDLEKRYVHKSGRPVWVNLRGSLVRDKLGMPVHFTGHIVDITETRKARIDLIERKKELQTIFQSQTEGLVVWSSSWDLVAINNAAREILQGEPASDSAGPSWLSTQPDLSAEDEHPALTAYKLGEPVRDIQQQIVTGSGKAIWLTVNASPVRNEAGSITHLVCSFSDITQRKKLEAELRQAHKMEVVGRLAGGVAHDFNNILTSILLNLEQVRNDPRLPEEQGDRVGEVMNLTKQGARLTKQLLEFSRQQPMTLEPIAVNQWLSNVSCMIRRIVGDPISLTTSTETEEIWVLADNAMLDQVMMNLVINARDAMPRGGSLRLEVNTVLITEESLSVHPGGRTGGFACISVGDSGIGMDEEILKKAFEPFFTTKEVGKGTGLSLPSCLGIVHQHKGWIEVESQPNVGSEFRIYLPLTESRPRKESAPVSPPIQDGTETILIVEDQAVLRKLVTKLLIKLGYDVLTACDGVEAQQLWEVHRNRINLLISDVMMPNGISGFDLQKGFRAEKPGLKVILMSGFSSVVSEEIQAEDILFLPKPFTTDQLTSMIRSCFA